MLTYYCKNCNNIVGKWDYEYKYYYVLSYYCNFINSKNINTIFFLDCKNCNKFVGLECKYVCENCFGEKEILFGEKILYDWFLKYKQELSEIPNHCKICNKDKFRFQNWFFKELTFYK